MKEYRNAHVIAADIAGYYNQSLHLGKYSGLLSLGFALSNIGNKINYGTEERLFCNEWLKKHGDLFLSDDLNNYPGEQYTQAGKDIFGCFSDALPDRWGRTFVKFPNK